MGDDRVVGYRFYPTEEELLCYYLPNKLNGTNPNIDRVIPLVHIYDYNPWDLPQVAGEVCRADTDTEQWFFFTPKQERQSHGGRPNRLTGNGYWKATGSPSDVYTNRNLRVGRKKTMVFYEGRAPTGIKTAWKMNEYKLYEANHQSAAHPQLMEDMSLCRIYRRSKCTRMFDRRLQTEEAALDQAAGQYYQQHHRHIHNTTYEAAIATDNQQNNIQAVEENGIGWGIESQAETLKELDIFMLLDWFDI